MIKMKLVLVLLLLVSLECHTVTNMIRKAKYHATLKLTERKKSLQGNLSILTQIFRETFGMAQESKLFNFYFGMIMQIFDLMNGNAIMDTAKCVVKTVEVYFTSAKFENLNKSYSEIIQEVENNPNSVSEIMTNLTENEGDIEEIGEGTGKSELDVSEMDCKVKKEISKELEDDKITDPNVVVSILDGDEDIEDVIGEATLSNENQAANSPSNAVPKVLRRLKTSIQKKIKSIKEVLSTIKRKIRGKIKTVMKKFNEKFPTVIKKVREFLDKPLVKSIIHFVECALPSLVELIAGGIAAALGIFTGYNLFSLIRHGPKFVKMLLDSFKNLRTGFMETKSIQKKYLSYGKGTASIVMLIILSTIGN